MAPHDASLRSGAAADRPGAGDRDARIEHLLLAGLDEYFAGRYEQAITLWTRVLFFDRHHDRARAYIERARRAQAELQRESEAVLDAGVQAFHEGDVARARELVAAALERGAPHEDALGLLDRIERLWAGRTAPAARPRTRFSSLAEEGRSAPAVPQTRNRRGWTAGLLTMAGIGVLAVGALGFVLPEALPFPTWGGPAVTDAHAARAAVPAPLPVPEASERFFTRARALYATGRLRDALEQLDRIPVADPLVVEADRLRASIQRELLAVAAAERPVPASDPAPRPPE